MTTSNLAFKRTTDAAMINDCPAKSEVFQGGVVASKSKLRRLAILVEPPPKGTETGQERGRRLRRERALMRRKHCKRPRTRKPKSRKYGPVKPPRKLVSCGQCPELEKLPDGTGRYEWHREKCGYYGDMLLMVSGRRKRCDECIEKGPPKETDK